MKVSAINQTWYRQYNYQSRLQKNNKPTEDNNVQLSNQYYYTTNISFGLEAAGKLKELFARGLPCMYTGIEMIDPKRVLRLIKNKAFTKPAIYSMRYLSYFEKSIKGSKNLGYIEEDAYNVVKEEARLNPNLTLREIVQKIAPQYKKELKRIQDPIFKTLEAYSYSLPDEQAYMVRQYLKETRDKIDEKPVAITFSVVEFKYKLEKIKQDVAKMHDKKSLGIVNKLIKDSESFDLRTTEKNIKQQRKLFADMEKYFRHSILAEHEQLKTLMQVSRSRLNNERVKIPFSRKVFINDIDRMLSDIEDQELKKVFIKIAEKLPTSRDCLPAYIAKISKESSDKIAYRLLNPYFASVEHILPESWEARNCMSNYGGACSRENSDRSSIPFVEQMVRRPQTAENCQNYINRLIKYARGGVFEKIGLSEKYIEDFKKAIEVQSNGTLILDTSDLYRGRFCVAQPAIKGPLQLNQQKLRILQS